MTPLALVASPLAALSDAWAQEAEQRKARTPNDPAAEALASCASELKAKIEQIDRDTAHLTVEQYATAQGVDPSTVRRLCLRGEIEGAVKGADNEWHIPRDARRVARRKVSA